MLSFQEIEEVSTAILSLHPTTPLNYSGAPGLGKTACGLKVAANLGVPEDRISIIHLNDHDVVDFTGVPSVVDGMTVFHPTEMFYKFREGTGKGFILLEELAQTPIPIQTFTAGFIEERVFGKYKLDPEVRIVCTGNRAQDRSGAKPLLAHLNDRLIHFDMVTSLDDWCAYAMSIGVNPWLIAFIRLRPDLLNNFDPVQRSNGTQRSWIKVDKTIPMSLPTNLYLAAVAGKVGEANAAEWVAAKDMMHKMPSVDAIRLHPDTMEIPDEPAVKFAVSTSMSMTATADCFGRDMVYIDRMPKEFQMVYVTDVLRLNPALQATPDFIAWAIANKDIFLGSN